MAGESAWMDPAFADRVAATDPLGPLTTLFHASAGLAPVEHAMSVDVQSYPPDDLLVKVDIATMAHGLDRHAFRRPGTAPSRRLASGQRCRIAMSRSRAFLGCSRGVRVTRRRQELV